jgi:ubiquinone/menaquinone biosynthesis C-methylase UbiE
MLHRIKDQYSSSKNLEERKNIYRYSINPETFSKWLTEQIAPGKNLKILELGCGIGDLWKDLKPSFQNCEILLSDLSEGMLEKAIENLGAQFNYEIIDFHRIPYPNKTFDIVISNHNLYHAIDLNKVLGEISRVIKDDGIFYSTTNSTEHLTELWKLIDFPEDMNWLTTLWPSIFSAETGTLGLSNHFQFVKQQIYQNELHIPDSAPIINYFMSLSDERVHQIVLQSVNKIREKIEAEIRRYGYFNVKTKSCLFICRK